MVCISHKTHQILGNSRQFSSSSNPELRHFCRSQILLGPLESPVDALEAIAEGVIGQYSATWRFSSPEGALLALLLAIRCNEVPLHLGLCHLLPESEGGDGTGLRYCCISAVLIVPSSSQSSCGRRESAPSETRQDETDGQTNTRPTTTRKRSNLPLRCLPAARP
jgi:hypothetical protein